MKFKFMTIKIDDKQNTAVDKKGNCIWEYMELTLDAALEIITKAIKIKKFRYGFEVYLADKSIFFRFGNITTKVKDNVEDFIKKNWR